jgi:hypothetical protein
MNEKMNVAGSSNGARGCDRSEELVTYLYGDAAPTEAKDFRRHLTSCAVCRDEMAAFGGVRELVGVWRAEVLGAVPSLGMDASFATAPVLRPARARKRSAIAALREFFSLSPLWLQAGAVAATLAFCALAALTLARAEVRWDANGFAFNAGVKERVVEKEKLVQVPVATGLTQEQVNAQIAAAEVKWENERRSQSVIVQTAGSRRTPSPRNAGSAGSTKTPSGSSQRNQLAGVKNEPVGEDLFNPNEERMPRLTDLLGAVKSPNKVNER